MKFRSSSLTLKLFIICFVFVSGTVFSISQLSYRFIANEIRGNNEYFLFQMLSKVDQYLTVSYTSLQTAILFVEAAHAGAASAPLEELRPQLQKVSELNSQYVKNMYLIKSDLSIVGGSVIASAFNDPSDDRGSLYEQAVGNPYSLIVSKSYVSRLSGWTITIGKLLPGSNPPAVLAVDIDLLGIEQTLLQFNREDSLNLILLDEDGRIVAGKPGSAGQLEPDTGFFTINGVYSADIARTKVNIIRTEDGGKRVSLLKRPATRFNWSIVSVNNETYLTRSLNRIEANYSWLLLVGSLLSLLVATVVTRYIRKPLGQLMRKMNQVRSGNLDADSHIARKDEFGLLANSFDQMLAQIRELIANLNVSKEMKRELEIQVLQSQINPHFLYNTLGSISNVVQLRRYEQVDPIIESLIHILEYGIADIAEPVTLRDEMENVRNYLYIQNIRYQQRFELKEEIEPDLLDYRVFRMLLQPLVENSLFHGYKGGRLQGPIFIRASRSGGDVVVEVADRGIGMNEEAQRKSLVAVRETERSMNRRRIGLANIHQRIRLYYGEAYGLRISSSAGQGTSVKAVLPDDR